MKITYVLLVILSMYGCIDQTNKNKSKSLIYNRLDSIVCNPSRGVEIPIVYYYFNIRSIELKNILLNNNYKYITISDIDKKHKDTLTKEMITIKLIKDNCISISYPTARFVSYSTEEKRKFISIVYSESNISIVSNKRKWDISSNHNFD